MPIESPGARIALPATKACQHGDPAVELAHPGVAAKSAQIQPATPSVANAAAAQQIAIGETFTLMMSGTHEVRVPLLPGGAVAGSLLYIKAADNSLALAATALTAGILNAGFFRFGVVDSIDSVRGRALVNLNLRGAF